MEFLGSGGLILLIITVAWLAFLTPTGTRSVKTPKKNRVSAIKIVRSTQLPANNALKTQTPINKGLQDNLAAVEESKKVVINRLPDPLSARLGSIENVEWAQVHDLEKVRTEREQISSETLDEIMQRRRSNG
ncbi:MAG: hypothetical protein RIQ88_761 [Actinomycetota bacterium]|jgi:hypothetical protein